MLVDEAALVNKDGRPIDKTGKAIVDADGKPVPKAGPQLVMKRSECADAEDEDECNNLFLAVSSCLNPSADRQRSAQPASLEACTAYKIGDWADSNLSPEEEEEP